METQSGVFLSISPETVDTHSLLPGVRSVVRARANGQQTEIRRISERKDVIAVLLTLLTGAVATDLAKRKIYNCWVLPGLLAGFLTAFLSGGTARTREALLSMFFAFAVLFPVYLIGGIGAGDVKLFAACATCLTLRETAQCITISFLVGGAASLILLLMHRKRGQTIRFAVPILVSVLFITGG